MARATTLTKLSLDRFAQLVGLNPLAFNQASAINMTGKSRCGDIFFQYNWQNNSVIGREEIAMTIAEVEKEIESHIGFALAPTWAVQEVHRYPQYMRKDMYGVGMYDVRYAWKSITTERGRLISPGQRATALVATATTADLTLVYSDANGDGLYETATITLPVANTDVPITEIKLYTAGKSAAPTYEIRPVKSIEYNGLNLVITVNSWQLIDPDLWEELDATGNAVSIDIQDTTEHFVESVDVYREYADTTAPSAVFYWEPGHCSSCSGAGCAQCQLVSQNGCMFIRDSINGVVAAQPATYDADSGTWVATTPLSALDPNEVKLYYRHGYMSDQYLDGQTLNPMDAGAERAIMGMVLARLDRDLCTCKTVLAQQQQMQREMSMISDGTSYMLGKPKLNNPFGTRYGEIKAWEHFSKFTKKRPKVGLVM